MKTFDYLIPSYEEAKMICTEDIINSFELIRKLELELFYCLVYLPFKFKVNKHSLTTIL